MIKANKSKLQLIHQESSEECFEILKTTIVEDKELQKYRIDKDILLQNLPENIVNEFLDWLGNKETVFREVYLKMIKEGILSRPEIALHKN